MRVLTADTKIRVKTPRKTPVKKSLTGDTHIRLDKIIGLKEWHEQLIQDKRRWADGKLHVKMKHGWRTVSNYQDYELKEVNKNKAVKKLQKTETTQQEFDDFVEKLFNKDYQNTPNTIHLPKINKGLAKTLNLKDNTQFIYKEEYKHINPYRKNEEEQGLTKEEYKMIPEVIRKAKTAYMDKANKNFYLAFEDKNDPDKINKIVFNKTPKGNYIVTVGKVNKKDELTNKKNLPVRGRS